MAPKIIEARFLTKHGLLCVVAARWARAACGNIGWVPACLTSMLLLFAARQHVSSPARENAIWVGMFKVLF